MCNQRDKRFLIIYYTHIGGPRRSIMKRGTKTEEKEAKEESEIRDIGKMGRKKTKERQNKTNAEKAAYRTVVG